MDEKQLELTKLKVENNKIVSRDNAIQVFGCLGCGTIPIIGLIVIIYIIVGGK